MADTDTELKGAVSRLSLEVAVGVGLGFIGSSTLGPRLISWWYEPPSQDAFSCAGSVRTALGQFVVFQLSCAAAGGVALAALLFFGRRALKKRAEKAPTA